jgi:hypothetical protein
MRARREKTREYACTHREQDARVESNTHREQHARVCEHDARERESIESTTRESMRAHALEPSIHMHPRARECMLAACGMRHCGAGEERGAKRRDLSHATSAARLCRAPRVMCVRAHVAGTCVGSRVSPVAASLL